MKSVPIIIGMKSSEPEQIIFPVFFYNYFIIRFEVFHFRDKISKSM